MYRYVLLLVMIISLVSACEKENSTACEPEINANALDGEWHIVNVSCECPLVNLELGENIWTINVAAGTLVVEDNTTEEYPAVPETGTYELIVTPDSLYYELPYGYIYYFEGGDLFLDQQSELDGPLVRLTRP